MVRAGADFSAMRREMARATDAVDKFQIGITRSMRLVGVALAGLSAGVGIKQAADDAIKFEAALQQVNRMLGSSGQEFEKWANESAIAFNMSRSEAVRYGAIYANLISTFTKDTKTAMLQTQALLKASAIISGATGRDMEDVMFRIRSGMLGNTEAIEDLGVNVNVAMLESTDAFRRFANGKSWDQLSFQVQQQIRLFGILEQTTFKYGDTIADNTASKLGAFTAQLKNVKLSLGEAFLPIINSVLPSLTRLAESLSRVMVIVAQFTSVLFGYEMKKQASSTALQTGAIGDLGDAYTKAGKAASRSVAGFDEVNNLAESSGDGVGGGSAPALPSFDTGGMDGLNEVGAKTQEISAKVREAAEKVRETYEKIKKAVNDLWDDMRPFSQWLGGEYKRNWGILGDTLEWIWKNITIPLGNAELWLWREVLEPFGKWLKDYYIGFWGGVGDAMAWVWNNVTIPIGNAFKWLWTDVMVPFGKFLGEKFVAAWNAVKESGKKLWEDVLKPFGAWLGNVFIETWSLLKGKIDSLKTNTLIPLGEALKKIWNETLVPFGNYLKDKFTLAWDAVGKAAGRMKTAIINTWNDLKTETGEKLSALKTFIGEKWDAIVSIDFSGMKTAIVNVWEDIKTSTRNIWDSIANGIKDTINTVIHSINGFISKVNGIEIKVPTVDIPLVGKVGGFSIGMPNIPSIPALAKGGITSGPMLAMIGDNPGGEEVVSPLSDLNAMIQSAVLVAQSGGNQNQRSQGDIVLQIDGITFARIMNAYNAKESTRIGGSMLKTT
jgi:hypothetical protein